MAKQTIDVGTVANDGTGDPLRDAMIKINDNFDELYSNAVITDKITVGNSTVNSTVSNTGGFASGNSTTNVVSNSTNIKVSNSTTNTVIVPGTITLGNVEIYGNSVSVGNSTINLVSNSSSLKLSNSVAISTFSAGQIYVGANVSVNTRAVEVGNSTINAVVNSLSLSVSNSSTYTSLSSSRLTLGANVVLSTSSLTIGNSVTNAVINSSSLNVSNVNISQNTGLSLGSYSTTSNGYTYLPNGLLLNWGWTEANDSVGNIVFSAAFSTTCLSLMLTSNTPGPTYQAAVSGTNSSAAEIKTANAFAATIYYNAIGY